jgi:hypothetical protein
VLELGERDLDGPLRDLQQQRHLHVVLHLGLVGEGGGGQQLVVTGGWRVAGRHSMASGVWPPVALAWPIAAPSSR